MDREPEASDTRIQRVAGFVLSTTLELQKRLMDENSAAFRWLMASLLAVNGGSALGILSSESVCRDGVVLGGAIFTAGIFSALLLGFFTLKSAERAIDPISKMIEFWLEASLSGEFDEKLLQERQGQLKSRLKPTKIASYLTGFSSAICFLVGSVVVGLNLK